MTTADSLAIAATIAGLLMGISPTLQIRRMFQTRSSRDVSIGYLSMLCVGFVAWVSYGTALGNLPMMLTNTVSLTIMLMTITVALSFRRRGDRQAPPEGGATAA